MTKPFNSAESAFFWFMRSRDSTQPPSHNKSVERAVCEPADIMGLIDRLRREQLLTIDHLNVLAHYGRKGKAPNPHFHREEKASMIWAEAMRRLGVAMERKGIVRGRVEA